MATLKLYQPINMSNLQAWDGTFPIVDSGHIRATDGVRTQDYFGSFQFSNGEVSGGTLTSTAAYQNGGLYYEVTGINADAATMAEYIGGFDFKSALNEVLKGNDIVIGSSGNDVIKSGAGNDTINGGGGIDTVQYNSKAGLIVTRTVDANGRAYAITVDGKHDVLSNVERIGFSDGSTLAIDVESGQNAGAAYRLYQAAFDRTPDNKGLTFWTEKLDQGVSMAEVAMGFVNSNEFKANNPNTDSASLINSYYQHVLHRAPDATGLQYWSSQMANGAGANDVLVAFSESNENVSNTAAELQNGVWM